ncbi:MBL fold metallo-hydrolase [Candidatus Parcubacteria bacterium]|nr:MBL fold metallo-hydrolase [Candidatus Parcubacteria bacterium]
MEIKYFGGNCIRLQTKKVSVVIDDNLEKLGQKSSSKPTDIEILTSKKLLSPTSKSEFLVDTPGEYEIRDVSIQGVAARAHIDEEHVKSAVCFRLIIDDVRVCVLGHIYPDLSDEQLEAIGMVDILTIPVGGSGYTIDAIGALKLIKKIEPKLVIPTHYDDKALKYEVPQADLESVRKTFSMEPAEELEELKIKGREFAEGTRLVILKRQQ